MIWPKTFPIVHKHKNETLGGEDDVDGDNEGGKRVGRRARTRREKPHDDEADSGTGNSGRAVSRKKENQEFIPPGFCTTSVVNMTCKPQFPGHYCQNIFHYNIIFSPFSIRFSMSFELELCGNLFLNVSFLIRNLDEFSSFQMVKLKVGWKYCIANETLQFKFDSCHIAFHSIISNKNEIVI